MSEEAGQKFLIIDRKLVEIAPNYADAVTGRDASFEVIVDRREVQRPFVGTDRRRVTTPS
ncbi:MAG: hypothetical protein ACYCXU_04270 [Thermoleophilia bacterium]|jgi:hypothetical protein|nr:hypothetical protein [Actinomycetota bacterium]MCL6093092.1 hypothetical protein [Actinomycetota bacterium]MDA8167422.1 hypothetical protein [Actinomycetota bacterium]